MRFEHGRHCSRLLALLALTLTASQAQPTQLIDVTASRPLWQALDALEIILSSTINYEDSPYENMADLQDFSTPQQRSGKPGYQLLGPREGQVRAAVQRPAAENAGDNEVVFDVNLLLASYRQNKLPGEFKVEQANGMFYVIPTKVLGANGVLRDVTSPLTARVTIPSGLRNVADTTEAILDAVYGVTGMRITIGAFPFRPDQMVAFSASAEPARDALARLFAEAAGVPLSYRLNFAPKPDRMRIFDYALNVGPSAYIGAKAASGARAKMAPTAPASPQGANSGPGRTKVKP